MPQTTLTRRSRSFSLCIRGRLRSLTPGSSSPSASAPTSPASTTPSTPAPPSTTPEFASRSRRRPSSRRADTRETASTPAGVASRSRLLAARPRLVALVALCSILVVLAGACGSSQPTEAESTSPTTAAEVAPTTSETGTAEPVPSPTPEPPSEPPETPPPPEPTTTAEPTTTEPATTTTESTTTTEPTTTTTEPTTTTTEPPDPEDSGGENGEDGQGANGSDSGSGGGDPPPEELMVNPADFTSPALCRAAGFFWNEKDDTCTASLPPYDAPGDLEVPQPLPPGSPGEIIDTELLSTDEDVVGYRILYHSTSPRGNDIAVSGFAAAPSGEAPEGGWPLVAWAHGTTGMADACAPSHTAESAITQFAPLLNAGYAIVATDYEGLGTPGLHPYIVGVSEGRSVLDSVRAAQALPEISVSEEFVVWGHSQGGHAALHTGQNWQEYAPSLKLLGVVSSAPPSQFSLIYEVLVNGPFRGYLVMAMAAFADAYPEANLEDILTPRAIELLDSLEEECLGEVLQRFAQIDLSELQTVPNPLRVDPWNALTLQNDVNQKPTPAPVLLLHGGADEQVPALSSFFLQIQICALPGQGPVHRIEYPGERHSSVIIADFEDMLEWIQARFEGETAPNTCESS